MSDKLKVGILGATGMVGQRFVTLLAGHPWFEVTCLAASPRSAGKCYSEAVDGRWKLDYDIPEAVSGLTLQTATDVRTVASQVDFVFSALDMPAEEIKALEFAYAAAGIPVVSNNSAHRWTPEVPVIIPEVNPDHLKLIELQQGMHNWSKGFVVCKPNCSIQSYVPLLAALRQFVPSQVFVATYQAISGAGKLLTEADEIHDNVMPLPGEELKSEREPLKVLGRLNHQGVVPADIRISAHCQRVPVADGHKAVCSVAFNSKPNKSQIIEAWSHWNPVVQELSLPSAPTHPIFYFPEELSARPEVRRDRDMGGGMQIVVGRLRECGLLDWKFDCLSHNTIRGAAGGAILTAELLHAERYLG